MQIDMIYPVHKSVLYSAKNYADNQFILKSIWSFVITTNGFDFENHNTPHALMEEMEEKFMQDFLPDPNFFLISYRIHVTQINKLPYYRHEIKFTIHALNASYHYESRLNDTVVVSSIIGV